MLEIKEDNTGKVVSAIPKAIDKALEEIGIAAEGDVVGYITANHIIDTGNLRNSITHVVDSGSKFTAVGTNVEYGIYVHEGTRKMKKRPFLTDPVSKNSKKYRSILEAELKNG